MAHVLVLDSLNEDIFVCGLCKSIFNSLEVFLNHKKMPCMPTVIEIATTELPLSITPENSSVETIHFTNLDNATDESAKDFLNLTCILCGKTFKNKKSLGAHTKSHTVKSYQCPVCGRCFMQNSHLERHVPSHKVWPESLSKTTAKSSEVELLSYSCPYCKVVFSNYNEFRSHLKNHQEMKKFKCIQGDCVHFFETLDGLLQHVALDHMLPIYHCYNCKKPFNSLESIATHEQSHSSYGKIDKKAQVSQYKCVQCDAVFKKPEKLSLHMITENHNKICIHCNKTFASDKRLRLHLQIHRNVKPYHCSICASSFHMKKYLNNHMLKHGSREFKCSICKNMFKRQDLLQRHMKLHQRNNLFKCPYRDVLNCKREFSRKDKLKLHIKSHTKHAAVCKMELVKEISEDCNITESGL